jgi:broad specificity phosphatase PhoE
VAFILYSGRMGTLYFVRHGQASFGAANYDQLSPLGYEQAAFLGAYFAAHGIAFEATLTGSLARHRQTHEGILTGMGLTTQASSAAAVWPGLNEYKPEAVVRSVYDGVLDKPDTPQAYKAHFQLLRKGLTAWSEGLVTPEGMPTYSEFKAGVHEALAHVQAHCKGPVLVVSSGGPISMVIADLMGASAAAGIELNFRMRNSAVSEMEYSAKRHTVVSFNTLPHLASPERAKWVTFT